MQHAEADGNSWHLSKVATAKAVTKVVRRSPHRGARPIAPAGAQVAIEWWTGRT